ncbi:MAG: hypothetical protein V1789_04720 [PVC group bacterium]
MNPIIEKMRKDPEYSRYALPINEDEDFRDAMYFLKDDGTFIFSEGYYHQIEKPREERIVNSHYFYVPLDPARKVPKHCIKKFFGLPFENITRDIMENEPLDQLYPLQLARYIELDPTQKEIERPVYGIYKARVPLTSLVAYFPHRNSLQRIMEKAGEDLVAGKIKTIAEHTADLLETDISQLGISGSVSLGTYANPHDLDFVVYTSTPEIKRIVDFMYTLTDGNEERQVYEFGKYWPIRFWDRVGDERFMVCPFFSFLDPEEAPLRNFDCEDRGPVVVEATVADDTFNAVNPTILMLEDVKVAGKADPEINRLIIHHGAERGDWREGNRIRVKGHRVWIRTYRVVEKQRQPLDEYIAVMEDNLGDVRLAE